MDSTFKTNLALNVNTEASSFRGELPIFSSDNTTDGNKETYWATDDNITTGSIELLFNQPSRMNYLVIQEYIKLGQRIKSFTVESWTDNAWKPVASATTIGYKRILKLDGIETNKLRINITASKACPLISTIEIY